MTRAQTNDSMLDDAERSPLPQLPAFSEERHVADGGTHSPIIAQMRPIESLFEVVAADPKGGRQAIRIERRVAPRAQPDDKGRTEGVDLVWAASAGKVDAQSQGARSCTKPQHAWLTPGRAAPRGEDLSNSKE